MFFGKIEIEAVQSTLTWFSPEYTDTSNAAAPELDDGMIPVAYDEAGKVWRKVDTTKKWYSYDHQAWANAVTVTKTNRATLLAAPSGTIIPISDINTMWVWVPRYSYTIGNTYGVQLSGGSTPSLTTPGAIDIKFISKDTALENGSAKYTGSTPSNWYTHPAFCFGTFTTVDNRTTCDGDEVNGIWVSKFEANAPELDACTTSPSEANCNKNTLSPISKPNLSSWRYVQVGSAFTAIQTNMNGMSGTTTYGFNASSGESHMMKNMEWGAVSYLTQSKYGKYGNSNYKGPSKELYINNYSKTSGEPLITMTGCSSGEPSTNQSIGTCAYPYNEVAFREEGTGAGGNVTGLAFPPLKYVDRYVGPTGFKEDTTNVDGTAGW